MKNKTAEIKNNVGQLVKKRRIKKRMSQKVLSQKANVCRSYISLIEKGQRKPSYETLKAISYSLNEDMGALTEACYGKGEPEYQIAYMLENLIKSKDKEKLNQLIEIIKSLSAKVAPHTK
jgi:transcriptional regulator with XRE-family HTH domain